MGKLVIRNWSWIFWDMYDHEKKKLQASETYHLIDLFKKDYHVMPKGKSTGTANKPLPAKWANANLSAEHATEIVELRDSKVDPMEYLLQQVANGCTFSVKYREDKADFLAYLFEPDADNPLQSYGLSAYATDIRTALIVLCYKHDVILGGYAGNGITESSAFG